MSITVKSNPPASESRLLATEDRIGARIPDGYRNFLMATDGGKPVENAFPADPDVGVDWFMGAVEIVETSRRLRGRLPSDLIPIAAAAGGNQICISVKSGRYGAILLWDHEREQLEDAATRWLAPSFDEFVAQLTLSPPVHQSKARAISVSIDPEFLQWAKEQEALEDARPRLRWPLESPPSN